MSLGTVLVLLAIAYILKEISFNLDRRERKDRYNNVYLKSDDWQRKRALVLKRDGGRCVYCGNRATQVHHKRYARRNVGREPIDWLVSICAECHRSQHK
jgi:5-methylcytosine-specific restriction endonuclease McrA